MRHPALLLVLLGSFASSAVAQPVNTAVFQDLALRCVAFVTDSSDDLIIDTPAARMPYVRSAIVQALDAAGRQVYLADSTYTAQPENLSTLRYQVDGSSVDYKRLRKKRAQRSVSLTASAALIDASGALVVDKSCNELAVDTVAIGTLKGLENSVYRETQGPTVRAGFGRRFLQPIMLTAATSLSVYLFFALRSDSNSERHISPKASIPVG